MGTKAFLQQGRGKAGIILPANAVDRVNQTKDRSALIRAAERKAAQSQEAAEPLPETIERKSLTDVAVASAASLATLTVESARAVEPVVPVEPAEEPTDRTADEPSDDLTVLAGVGPAMATRLNNYGFASYADMARADASTLNDVPGAKGRGERWVQAARKLAGLI